MIAQPFCEKPTTNLIMKDERFTQGLARLQYLLLSGSIAVVYEQTGVGKSTLLIDEAHLLSTDVLTDLRLLIGSTLDSSTQLKIILSGQEHLKSILKRDILADFAQRISVHYHVPTLTKAQTAAYINFPLKSSGASEKVFDSNVKDLIHESSAGVPRQINSISTACLINASCKQSQIVTLEIFNQALTDFNLFKEVSHVSSLFTSIFALTTKRRTHRPAHRRRPRHTA